MRRKRERHKGQTTTRTNEADDETLEKRIYLKKENEKNIYI